VNWIRLFYTDQWWSLASGVINVKVRKSAGNFWLADKFCLITIEFAPHSWLISQVNIVICQRIARQRVDRHPAIHARNNITTGLCNPFINYGSVNTLSRRRWRHTTEDSDYVTCFLLDQPERQWASWIVIAWCAFCMAVSVQRLYKWAEFLSNNKRPECSRKLEEWVILGLLLSSEVPKEEQCGQKKNRKSFVFVVVPSLMQLYLRSFYDT
jgi:hypothetical protein